MNDLKRKMLRNPNCGRQGGHPQPIATQSFTKPSPLSKSIPPPFPTRETLRQPLNHHQTSSYTPTHPYPSAVQTDYEARKITPPKPKSIVLPPQPKTNPPPPPSKPPTASEVVKNISEPPRLERDLKEEVNIIKSLRGYKAIIVGTILFILGLVVSAGIAIIFQLI